MSKNYAEKEYFIVIIILKLPEYYGFNNINTAFFFNSRPFGSLLFIFNDFLLFIGSGEKKLGRM
jgi:hypothetical protein